MGLSTASISFYNGCVPPEQYKEYSHFCNNDRTILYDEKLLERDINRVARKLSKIGMCSVMSFFYFDDDCFSLSLHNAGKIATTHCYGSTMNRRGKPDAFREEFRLDEQAVKLLRAVFRMDSMSEQIQCLESIFQCPLIVDEEQEVFSFLTMQEIERKINALKIKNQTKSEILFELPGKLQSYHNPPYFIQDNTLMKLEKDNSLTVLNTKIKDRHFYISGDSPAPFYNGNDEQHIDFYSDTGVLEKRLSVAYMVLQFPAFVTRDEKIIYTERGLTVKKIDKQGNLEWQIPHSHTMQQHGNSILISLTDENWHLHYIGCIAMADAEGQIYAKYRFEETTPLGLGLPFEDRVERYGETYMFLDNGLLAFDYIISDHNIKTHVLLFLDENLNVFKRFEYDNDHQNFSMFYDERNNRLFLTSSGCFTIFNMSTFTFERTINHQADMSILHVNGNIYMHKLENTLCVYDDMFTLIAKHNIKGSMCSYYGDSDNGNPRFLACANYDSNKPIIRCYEISMK